VRFGEGRFRSVRNLLRRLNAGAARTGSIHGAARLATFFPDRLLGDEFIR
jgi:hypothetical protein